MTTTRTSAERRERTTGSTRGRGAWLGLACLGVLAVGAGSAAAQPAASAWPLFHGDAQRTGRTTIVGPAAPTNVREVHKGYSAIRSSPVIGPDGTVYIGSGRQLCAIDPSDDSEKWCAYTTSSVAHSVPGIGVDPLNPANVLIYVGARDNKLHAIDQDGMERWNYFVGLDGDVATAPVITAGGTLFFGGSNRLNATTAGGSLLWVRSLDGPIFTGSPVLGPGNTLYVVTAGGSLYSIVPSTGAIRWRITIARNIRFAAPAVGPDGTIYAGTRDGLVAVTDHGSSATIKWRFEPIRRVTSTPAIAADGTVYVGGTAGPSGDAFFAVDPDGNALWTYQTSTRFRGSPILDGAGRLYTTSGRDVVSFDSASGALLWSYPTSRNIYSSPALGADGTLWVASANRLLYAISD